MAYSSLAKNPRADPDHHQKSTTSCSCLLRVVDVRFRVRQLSCLQNNRTKKRMTENDHITSAFGGGNNNNNNNNML